MKIKIHPSLARFAGGNSEVELPDTSVADFFSILNEHQQQLYQCLIDDEGDIRAYVNVYVNGKSLETLPDETKLSPVDEIDIVTSLVGG